MKGLRTRPRHKQVAQNNGPCMRRVSWNDNERHSRRTERHAPTSLGESGTEPRVGVAWHCSIFKPEKGAARSGHPQAHGEGGGKRVCCACKLCLRLHAWWGRTDSSASAVATSRTERTLPNVLARTTKLVHEQGRKLLVEQRGV